MWTAPSSQKGKTLFVIEQPPYQAQLAEAQAKLKSLQAQRAYAQAQLQRQTDLAPKGFSTQADLDQARAKRDVAGCRHPGCQGRDRHRHHQSRLHRGEGALRRGGHQPSPVGGRAGRRHLADPARHHRPDRSDLDDLQHERAGCAEDPRQHGQAQADPEGHRQGPLRGRADDRGGLSPYRPSRLCRTGGRPLDRHADGPLHLREQEPTP